MTTPRVPDPAAREPLAVVRALHARLETGGPLGTLVHEDAGHVGNPAGVALPPGASLEVVAAEARRQGFTIHIRRCEAGGPGRVLAEGVWSHDAPKGGSAGLFHAVYVVRAGRIALVRLFDDAGEARAFAFA